MRVLRLVPWLLLSVFSAAPAAAGNGWTLSGSLGVSEGNRTPASATWWGTWYYRIAPQTGFGIEAGSIHWVHEFAGGYVYDALWQPPIDLARGADELRHVSLSMRGWGSDRARAAYVSVGVGAYREANHLRSYDLESNGGAIHPGVSLSLGGAPVRGFGAGAEIRIDVVDTRPDPTACITVALGLHLNHRPSRRSRIDGSI